jgi:hypothetical protein
LGQPLTNDQIAAIMAGGRSRGPKKDPTEPRDTNTWFNLKNHRIREEGCDNPDCVDPRTEKQHGGVNITTEIKGKNMCRYCFLAGWLSDSPTAVI